MIITKVKCEIRVIALHLSKATGFLASASLAFLSRCGKMNEETWREEHQREASNRSALGRQASSPDRARSCGLI